MQKISSKPPPPRAILFDLDGTIVDSLLDIANACNHCLELLGLPPRPIDDFRHLVGEGIPKLCQRAIGSTHPHLLGRLEELMRARYRAVPLVHTAPYAGIEAVVESLVARGMPLGVLSNKPHELTVKVTAAFWTAQSFPWVQGYDGEAYRKPDPYHLLRYANEQGIAPAEIWLVGDTPTDIETARRAGANCIAVTWGFRPRGELEESGATWLIDRPHELLEFLSPAT
ncbi:MAG: HAD family hydrolase [Phycisphaerae bacterium]